MFLCPVVSHLVSAGDGSRRIPGTAAQRRPKSSRSAGEVEEVQEGVTVRSWARWVYSHIGELSVDELAVCYSPLVNHSGWIFNMEPACEQSTELSS